MGNPKLPRRRLLSKGKGPRSTASQFFDPELGKLVGIALNGLRFVPKAVKDDLQKKGLWEDMIQTIYTICCEYWRANADKDLDSIDAARCMGRGIYDFVTSMVPWRKKYSVYSFPSDLLDAVDYDDSERIVMIDDKALQTVSQSAPSGKEDC